MTTRICKRCEGELADHQAFYCSRACKKAMKRRRNRRSQAKRHTSAWQRRRAARAEQQRQTPYGQFSAAVGPRKKVNETDKRQRQARELVAAGAIAYENRRGLIRDVGKPLSADDAGRVFGFDGRAGAVPSASGRGGSEAVPA